MNGYVMNRESLKRHCEEMCKKFETVPDSGTYGEHRLVLELLEQTEWIPITEKLPPEGSHVLVSCKDGFVTADDYFSYGFDDWGDSVTAWMPLPKPYKELLDCTDCVLDGTDACPRGAGRAVDSEVCEEFLRGVKE